MIEQRSRGTRGNCPTLGAIFSWQSEKKTRARVTQAIIGSIWRYGGQLMVSKNSFGLNAPVRSKAATVDDRSQHERSIETYSEMPTAEKLFSIGFNLTASWSGGKSARQLFVADCDISRRLLCGICTVSECDLLTYCAMGRDGGENVGFATSHRYHNLCANVRRKKGDRSLYKFVLHALANCRGNDRFGNFDGLDPPPPGSGSCDSVKKPIAHLRRLCAAL